MRALRGANWSQREGSPGCAVTPDRLSAPRAFCTWTRPCRTETPKTQAIGPGRAPPPDSPGEPPV